MTVTSEAAISVEQLTKVYRRYASPFDRLLEMIVGGSRAEPIVALEPVSLRIERGEAVGIVG